LLIYEDGKDLRYFTRLLVRMGYSVRAFGNYDEAAASLRDGYFDLVIIDEGSRACGKHHLGNFTIGRERYTPVVVLTNCLDINRYVEATQLGVSAYLTKPLTAAEVERVVTTHCPERQG